MTEIDDRICDDYVAGLEVPQIAARYNVTEDYVRRVIDAGTTTETVKGHDWGLRPLGNRVMYSAVVAGILYAVTGTSLVLFAGVVVFLALSFFADRQTGSDRQT